MTYYIWDNETVSVTEYYGDVERRKQCWVFDTLEEPGKQWAIMYRRRWCEMTKDEVPKAFLTNLLLLGVST